MRKAITFLQSLYRLYGAAIDVDAVYMVSGVIPQVDSHFSILSLSLISYVERYC